MVTVDSNNLIGRLSHSEAIDILNGDSDTLRECLWRKCDIEICSSKAKLYALTTIESGLIEDSVIKDKSTTSRAIVVVSLTFSRSKSGDSCLRVDIQLTSNLLAIVTLNLDRLDNITKTSELNLQPTTYILQ